LPCLTLSELMIGGPKMKTKSSAERDQRAAGAEGDVAEDIEGREVVREVNQ
jgi:hypothetical protein